MKKLWVMLLTVLCLAGAGNPEEDLVVTLKRTGPERVQAGEPMQVEMQLKNNARKPVAVVKPGDGSESGWREPHVYFTAEQEVDGKWVELKHRGIGRCGLYDPDWSDEVVTLKPGDDISLKEWVPSPEYQFPFEKGRVRVRLHYVYSAGQKTRTNQKVPESMKGVPAFHLTSDPVEFEVVE